MPDSENNIFGERLAVLAAKQQLSQSAIASPCNLSPQSVQRWFAGTAYPRANHLPKLAELLRVPISELVAGVDRLKLLAHGVPDDYNPHSSSGPDNVFTEYYRALTAWRRIRRAYHRASASAVGAAMEALIDELHWAGYTIEDGEDFDGYSNPPLRSPTASTLRVYGLHSDIHYLLYLKINAPSPSEYTRYTARGMRDSEGDTKQIPISVTAFNNPSNRKTAFVLLPLATMDREQAVELVRATDMWVTTLARYATGAEFDDDDLIPPHQLHPYINQFNLEALG